MNVDDPRFEEAPALGRTGALRGGSPVLRRLMPLLMPLLAAFALIAVPAAPAHADACSNCPKPTLERLKQEADFVLGARPTSSGLLRQDYYDLDPGACQTTTSGTPIVTRGNAWLALRGTGEVWHCPHSKSVDAITVESSAQDSSEWSFSVKIGAEFRAFAAKVKAEVEAGHTTGVTITEVTKITKTITPTWCHRVTWAGYFEVANFNAGTVIKVKQRWAWWTKNAETGAKVHAKGTLFMDCGSQEVVLTRHAPIAGYFALRSRGCNAEECSRVYAGELGFFPLIPAYLEEPKLPWAPVPPATVDSGTGEPGTVDGGTDEPGTVDGGSGDAKGPAQGNADGDPAGPQGAADGGASTSGGD